MLMENGWGGRKGGTCERRPQKSRHDLWEVGRPGGTPQQAARFGRSARPGRRGKCRRERRCGIRPTWPPVPSWAIGMASGFRTHRFRLYRKLLWFAICHMW